MLPRNGGRTGSRSAPSARSRHRPAFVIKTLGSDAEVTTAARSRRAIRVAVAIRSVRICTAEARDHDALAGGSHWDSPP